jgi:hypothetical protein
MKSDIPTGREPGAISHHLLLRNQYMTDVLETLKPRYPMLYVHRKLIRELVGADSSGIEMDS